MDGWLAASVWPLQVGVGVGEEAWVWWEGGREEGRPLLTSRILSPPKEIMAWAESLADGSFPKKNVNFIKNAFGSILSEKYVVFCLCFAKIAENYRAKCFFCINF